MEVQFIEKFVRNEFPHLSIEDRCDLINTAWLFLAENDALQVSLLSDDLLRKLKRRLSDELGRGNWREMTVGYGPYGSEDEKLSYIRRKSEPYSLMEIKQEVEKSAAVFENKKEQLESLLPPILFEALCRGIFDDASVKWTAGFERQSLQILCWRALTRVKWIK